MRIIIYDPNTKEFSEFINSLKCNGTERIEAIDAYIADNGKEISAAEFVRDSYLYTNWSSKLRYKFIGEPCGPLEKMVKFAYGSASYINMKESFPEDFTESRTDWDDMVNYADEMASFINEIMEDLAK